MKDGELIAEALRNIALELRAQRELGQRAFALCSAIAVKQGVTESELDRVQQMQREHGLSLTELELRWYSGNAE